MSPRGPGMRAVHGDHGPRSGPLTPPIAQTATFAFSSSAEMRRFLDGEADLAADIEQALAAG